MASRRRQRLDARSVSVSIANGCRKQQQRGPSNPMAGKILIGSRLRREKGKLVKNYEVCSPALHRSSGSSQCCSMEFAADCLLLAFFPLNPLKRVSGSSHYGMITCNWRQYIRQNTAKLEKAAVGTWQDNRQAKAKS